MITILVVLLVLIAVGLGVFSVQNEGMATFHLWNWTWNEPIYYPVIGAAVAVLLAFVIYSSMVGTRWRVRHWHLHRSTQDQAAVIEDLRAENLRLHRQQEAAAEEAAEPRHQEPQPEPQRGSGVHA